MLRRAHIQPLMKRLALCFALGAVVNVLVAWGFVFVPRTFGTRTVQQYPLPEVDWPVGTPTNRPPICSEVSREEYFGTSFVTAAAIDPEADWGMAEVVFSIRHGAPFKSLEHSAFANFEGHPKILHRGSWDVSGAARALGIQTGRRYSLPLYPRPAGFAMNTLVYGAGALALTLLADGWRLWRRQKRSRCVRCGYDVNGVARCPECGVGVDRRGAAG